jgi:hypothetical protein
MSIPLDEIVDFIDDVEVLYKIKLERMGIETKYNK